MPISIYDASIPMLINMLGNMKAWLDKAEAQMGEASLIDARLIADMRPLTAQFQSASDSAKNGAARLAGITPPSMADTETSFAQLRERCDRTIAFLRTITPAQLEGSESRTVELRFPGGQGYTFNGLDYLTGFMLPNFFFHVQTAYAILRAQGVDIGKPDYLMHMGPPTTLPDPAA
jgi:hypothetical protein